MERDNAKSRYEKVLLVAPYSSEMNNFTATHGLENECDAQQRRDAVQKNSPYSSFNRESKN